MYSINSDLHIPWVNIFAGRKKELAAIKAAWHRVNSHKPTTEVVVLLAESGLGKTRLVQQFYNYISTAVNSEEYNKYWPDKLGRLGNDLSLNPELNKCNSEQKMPFLWWGVRAQDPQQRRASIGEAVSATLPILRPHLEYIEHTARKIALRNKQQQLILDVGKDIASAGIDLFTFGLLGHTRKVAEHVTEFFETQKVKKNLRKQYTTEDTFSRERESLVDKILADLRRILLDPLPGLYPVPGVIVIDDAHFAVADSTLKELILRLVYRSRQENWPLLLILTHWEQEWHTGLLNNGLPFQLKQNLGPEWSPLTIGKVDDLGDMLDAGLPGINSTQRSIILERADGNPQLLDEILRHFRSRSRYFINRNVNASLNLSGEQEIQDANFELHGLIEDRLRQAPNDIQNAVALSSLQGIRFLEHFTLCSLEKMFLKEANNVISLQRAERPYAFIHRLKDGVSEFAQRIYYEVAMDCLKDILDDQTALACIIEVLHLNATAEPLFSNFSENECAVAREMGITLLSGRVLSTDDRRLLTRCLVASLTEAYKQWDYNRVTIIFDWIAERLKSEEIFPEDLTIEELSLLIKYGAEGANLNSRKVITQTLIHIVTNTFEVSSQLSEALYRIVGTLHIIHGWHAAEPFLRDLVNISTALHQKEKTSLSYEQKINALNLLAKYKFDIGGWDLAKEPVRECLSLAYEARDMEDSIKNQRAVITALSNVLRLDSLQKNQIARLNDISSELIYLTRKVATITKNPEDQRLLAASLILCGNLQSKTEPIEEAFKILRSLLMIYPTPLSTFRLTEALYQNYRVFPDKAEDLIQEAIELCRGLVAEIEQADYKKLLAKLLSTYALHVWREDPDHARVLLYEVCDIYCALIKESTSASFYYDYIVTLQSCSNIEKSIGNHEKRLDLIHLAYEAAINYLQSYPSSKSRMKWVECSVILSLTRKKNQTGFYQNLPPAPHSSLGYWKDKANMSNDDLTGEVHRALSVLLGSPPSGLHLNMQDTSVPFYPGWRLIRFKLGYNGQEKWQSHLLFGDDMVVPLDMKSNFIHLISRYVPIYIDKDTILPFLRFFNDFVWGEDGPFTIVSDFNAIEWEINDNRESNDYISKMRDLFFPPQIIESPSEERPSWLVKAWLLFGARLYQVKFEITSDGIPHLVTEKLKTTKEQALADSLSKISYTSSKKAPDAPPPIIPITQMQLEEWSLYRGWPNQTQFSEPTAQKWKFWNIVNAFFPFGKFSSIKNTDKLLKEINLRAENGELEAIAMLGRLYLFGTEVLRNEETAINYLRRAAQKGDVRSMITLCLKFGWGSNAWFNKAESEKWFSLARQSKDKIHGVHSADQGVWVIIRLHEFGIPWNFKLHTLLDMLNELILQSDSKNSSSAKVDRVPSINLRPEVFEEIKSFSDTIFAKKKEGVSNYIKRFLEILNPKIDMLNFHNEIPLQGTLLEAFIIAILYRGNYHNENLGFHDLSRMLAFNDDTILSHAYKRLLDENIIM